jgi:hypothetical protein
LGRSMVDWAQELLPANSNISTIIRFIGLVLSEWES